MNKLDTLPPRTRRSRFKGFTEQFVSLAIAIILVLMVRSSIVEPFKIPSGSMIPTLFIGDHIFVNKFAYGLKVPFSDLSVFGGKPIFLVKRDIPKRGDIIVFIFPKDESLYYIKRVIGVPGDTIEYKDKKLTINGKPLKVDPMPKEKAEAIITSLDDPRFSISSMDIAFEQMDAAKNMRMIQNQMDSFSDTPAFTVPEDSLFVMGDNRDFSNDSRFWGFVPMDNVRGKAMFIWMSMWINFEDRNYSFRPDRIGTVLHEGAL